MIRSVLLALYLVAGPAQAHNHGPVEHVRVEKLGTLPYQYLFDANSNPEESLDSFVLRIAPELRAYSERTGFEACGAIAKTTEGTYSIIVGTNHSHIGCAVLHDKIAPDAIFTRQAIHSHGTDKPVRPTKADLVFFGPMLSKYGIGPNTRRPLTKIGGQGANDFSETDLKGLDGYLAGETRVLHHVGGVVRQLSAPGPVRSRAESAHTPPKKGARPCQERY